MARASHTTLSLFCYLHWVIDGKQAVALLVTAEVGVSLCSTWHTEECAIRIGYEASIIGEVAQKYSPVAKKTDLIQQCKEMNLPVHTSTGVSGRLLSSQELFDMSHRWKGVSPASRHESSDKAANTNTRYVEAFGGLSLRVNKHVCSGCRRHFFDPNDLHAKLKPRGSENALLCGYISNSCSTITELKLITIFLFRRLGEMMKKDPRACPDPRSSISIGGKAFLGETVKMA